VVPTFNEERNVERLVDEVRAALAGIDFEMIFVDDSTDRTPQIIMGLRTPFPVKLIHREPGERAGGLTTAIVRGLRAAKGHYVSVIDGDLQHPPQKLAELVTAARSTGADVVVASRYRTGGSAAGLPGIGRRLVSVGSKWISKALFYERLRGTSDPGSGFFLVRRAVIEGVELRPVGYKMLTEILVRGGWSRLEEVPYAFQARTAGASKAGLHQGWQYIQHMARIFVEVPHVARLWKFLTVGASGIAVNLGLLWSATALAGLPRYGGWTIGVEASVLSNFALNRLFTWRDRQARGMGAVMQGMQYHVASFAGVAANFIVFSAATALDAPVLLAGAFGIAAGVVTNFTGASQFVFGERGAAEAPVEEPVRLLDAAGPLPAETLVTAQTAITETDDIAA
jgi:dolichol-phosphate mannosyltransferase